MMEVRCFIGDRFVPSAGALFPTSNPATGERLATVAAASAAQVIEAIAFAQRAKTVWRETPATIRGEWLRAIADLLDERADELAALETDDTGLLLSLTRQGHLPRAAQCFRYFADAILEADQSFPLDEAYITSVRREPLGVVSIITPWNAPLATAAMNAAAALALGNCVVLKPSERSPLTTAVLAEIAQEVELPPGVLSVLQGGPDVGRALATAPGVDGICFIGGVVAGFEVLSGAALTLKRCVLELGGKSPTIVFADSNFEAAIDGALLGAFSSNGEVCAAGSRILVERSIHARFVEALATRSAGIRVGDPRHKASEMGPLIDELHRSRVEGFVAQAIEQGARAACLGGRPPGDQAGFYFRPTVLDRVEPEMAIAREEVFGPVVAVLPFEDLSGATSLANDSPYGLHASIWTSDVPRALRLARNIDAGSVSINAPMVRDIRAPFGGRKLSGLGRIGGRWSLDAYSEPKAIALAISPFALPRLGLSTELELLDELAS